DDRKKYTFIAIHYEDKLVKEVGKRLSYNHDELVWADYSEVSEILKGKDLHQALAERKTGFGVNFFTDCKHLTPAEVAAYWDLYATEKVQAGQAEVRGIVASRGKAPVVRGRAHILLDPHNLTAFQSGEILIAPMTSPEYVFAMKRAAAIVTDTGGLTSHAAIVSRELNLPCIVNTKAATQIFQSGDEIEVNAEKGVVRIL
ncbi:MAG: PEP-utilizing enzyme, partial [Patescibacteria group bacterium]